MPGRILELKNIPKGEKRVTLLICGFCRGNRFIPGVAGSLGESAGAHYSHHPEKEQRCVWLRIFLEISKYLRLRISGGGKGRKEPGLAEMPLKTTAVHQNRQFHLSVGAGSPRPLNKGSSAHPPGQWARRKVAYRGWRRSGAARTSRRVGPSDNTPTSWRHTGQENSNRLAKKICEPQNGHLYMGFSLWRLLGKSSHRPESSFNTTLQSNDS
jgi:hypothetical protein